MTDAMYASSIPVFKQMLGGLAAILAKAEAHVTEKEDRADGADPGAAISGHVSAEQAGADRLRFRPRRVGAAGRCRGAEVRRQRADLRGIARLDRPQLAFIDGFTPAQFEGAAQREIVTRPGTPKERRFNGQAYLPSYGLPQFFFHVTTAYALLRHNGIEIGKRDYMGSY